MIDRMERLGRYEILDEIGRGAMGVVYRARDPLIDRTVALKAIIAAGLNCREAEGFRMRFSREAQAAGRLSHPGIVTIYDVGEQEDTHTPYLVMEYVAGRTLSTAVVEADQPLSPDSLLDLIEQVAEALDYAHREGIVHRDIKPANILVTPQGRAKIADFGVAKLRLTQTQMTNAGDLLGTPSFMSPEQVDGKPMDGRSDLFSLGVIIYWVVSGQMPFDGDSPGELLLKILAKEHTPPSQINSSLGLPFDYVLGRALAKKPEDRYQTGKEFAEDLEDLRRGGAPRSQASKRVSIPGTIEKTVLLERPADGSFVPAAAEKTVLLQQPPEMGTVGAGRSVVKVDVELAGDYAKVFVQKALVLLLLLLRHAVDFAKAVPRRTRTAITWMRRAWEWARTLPRSLQIGVAALAILLIVVIGVSLGAALGPKATLRISLSGDVQSGEVSVWVDNRLVANGQVEAKTVRFAGIFRRTEGSYSKEVKVKPGNHVIRVQVVDATEGYNRTRETDATLKKDESRTLSIRCDWPRNSLSISFY
ncbi:MAG: serine/threonine-protein kinase [Candidatus Dormibacteria bacterium]